MWFVVCRRGCLFEWYCECLGWIVVDSENTKFGCLRVVTHASTPPTQPSGHSGYTISVLRTSGCSYSRSNCLIHCYLQYLRVLFLSIDHYSINLYLVALRIRSSASYAPRLHLEYLEHPSSTLLYHLDHFGSPFDLFSSLPTHSGIHLPFHSLPVGFAPLPINLTHSPFIRSSFNRPLVVLRSLSRSSSVLRSPSITLDTRLGKPLTMPIKGEGASLEGYK